MRLAKTKSFQPLVPLTLTLTRTLSFLYFGVILDSALQNDTGICDSTTGSR